jgi:hypothetical protein
LRLDIKAPTLNLFASHKETEEEKALNPNQITLLKREHNLQLTMMVVPGIVNHFNVDQIWKG